MYDREITVKVWGSDATILHEQRPLHLIVPNQQALLVSLLAIVSSCIGFAIVLGFHERIFAGFTTKHLIVIALFSTTVFVAVVVPSTLFLNLVSALLGPFSVLLTGLINETLYYALLTALLIYINGDPRNAETTNHLPREREWRNPAYLCGPFTLRWHNARAFHTDGNHLYRHECTLTGNGILACAESHAIGVGSRIGYLRRALCLCQFSTLYTVLSAFLRRLVYRPSHFNRGVRLYIYRCTARRTVGERFMARGRLTDSHKFVI